MHTQVEEEPLLLASLLQWQTLIYLVPFGIAALMLVLSAVRPRHGSGHSTHGLTHHHAAATGTGHTAHGAHARHSTAAAKSQNGGTTTKTHARASKPAERNPITAGSTLLHILGFDEVPMVILIESFFLAWGVGGLLANQYIGVAPDGNRSIYISLISAFAAGTIGTVFAGQALSRLLPRDENLAIERNSLFGATGEVAYTVTNSGGRILVYDQYGTLHDEMCTLAAGHQPIAKGQRARISDIDSKGRLVVEPENLDLTKLL